MLDLLKNKMMLSFIIFVLAVIYLDSANTKRLEEMDKSVEKNQIPINNN